MYYDGTVTLLHALISKNPGIKRAYLEDIDGGPTLRATIDWTDLAGACVEGANNLGQIAVVQSVGIF